MKKYLKMTFAALSAIALNFSCLAMDPQRNNAPEQNPNKVIRIHDNFQNRKLTPLSTEEQISLLKSAILASDVSLAKNILAEHVGKIGDEYFYTLLIPTDAENKRRYLGIHTIPCLLMSDEQFEELQLFSLEAIKNSNYINAIHKREIFKLITAKFYEISNNKANVCKTTARIMYSNREFVNMNFFRSAADNFSSPEDKREFMKQCLNDAKQDNNIDAYLDPFRSVITNFSSDDDKRIFVEQFLNDAKQDNNIDAYAEIFFALDNFSGIGSIFRHQLWLQPFIKKYLEQALSGTPYIILEDMPIYFIKEAAPDIYNEKFFSFLEKCITDDSDSIIDILLPIDEDTSLPLEDRRLSSEYLKLALENFSTTRYKAAGEYILSSVALYTDISSDLTDVVQTLANNIPQKKCQKALERIKKANINLYHSLLEH